MEADDRPAAPAHNPATVPDSTPSSRGSAGAGEARPAISGIDLSAAAKVVGESLERKHWLSEMMQPGGMSPGSSTRAHARAFRFAEALMKAGYRVTEAPLGPRGGRRFVLDGYDGPRAGLVYRLRGGRACWFEHTTGTCDCFDELSDGELRLVTALHRKANRGWGLRYGTDRIARLLRDNDEAALRCAVDLYASANRIESGGPTIEEYLVLLELYDIESLRTAVELFTRSGGARGGGADVESLVTALAATSA